MFNTNKSFVPGLVSVIIPTYNRSELVLNAIDSVLLQTYHFIEIIVVDDCSTDNTLSVLAFYGTKIRVIKNEVNSYVGYSRNLGVSLAKGEYVAFLDSDDKWLPNKLELQINWMKKNNYEISTSAFYTYHKGSNSLQFKQRPYASILNFPDILYGIFIAPGSTLMLKRNLFIELLGYDISFRRLEDWDLLIRIFLKYKYISFLNEPLSEIYASNEYTFNNLQKSGKKLFLSNYKLLFSVKYHYPVLLLVGILFEYFIASFRSKNYLKALLYFILFNFLSLFKNPYYKIHLFAVKKHYSKICN